MRQVLYFSKAPQFSGNLFYTYIGGMTGKTLGHKFLPSNEFARIGDFVIKLGNLGVDTSSYTIVDERSHEVRITDGGTIVFSTDDPYEIILENVRAILASEAFSTDVRGTLLEVDYIDLRFGNKVFYRLNE